MGAILVAQPMLSRFLIFLVGAAVAVDIRDFPRSVYTLYKPRGNLKCGLGDDYQVLVRRGTGAGERKILLEYSGGFFCADFAGCVAAQQAGRFESASAFIQSMNGVSTSALPTISNPALAVFTTPFGPLRIQDSLMFDPTSFVNAPGNEWTIIFAPYCTQDSWIGNADVTYTNQANPTQTITVRHRGVANNEGVLNTLFELFSKSTPRELLVAGCSSGTPAVPFAVKRLVDKYGSDVPITAMLDSALIANPPSTDLIVSQSQPGCYVFELFDTFDFPVENSRTVSTIERAFINIPLRFPQVKWIFIAAVDDPVLAPFWAPLMAAVGIDTSVPAIAARVELARKDETLLMMDRIRGLPNAKVVFLQSSAHCFFVGTGSFNANFGALFGINIRTWFNSQFTSTPLPNINICTSPLGPCTFANRPSPCTAFLGFPTPGVHDACSDLCFPVFPDQNAYTCINQNFVPFLRPTFTCSRCVRLSDGSSRGCTRTDPTAFAPGLPDSAVAVGAAFVLAFVGVGVSFKRRLALRQRLGELASRDATQTTEVDDAVAAAGL